MWGVGNHGGGPSRKDLEDLTDLIREKEKENVLIIHSTPEEYLAEIEKERIFLRSERVWFHGRSDVIAVSQE